MGSPEAGQDLSYTAKGASAPEDEVVGLFQSEDLSKLVSENLALSASLFCAPQLEQPLICSPISLLCALTALPKAPHSAARR